MTTFKAYLLVLFALGSLGTGTARLGVLPELGEQTTSLLLFGA